MKLRATLAPAHLASLASVSSRGSVWSLVAVWALVSAGAVAVSSCSGLPRGQDGVTAIQFPDMVVPDGLRLVDNAHQSHSVEAASWRQGRFVYSGTVRAEDAAGYVREQMPRHNWRLVADESRGPNGATLRYQRGYYAAEYTFSRANGRTQLVVEYDTDYSRR